MALCYMDHNAIVRVTLLSVLCHTDLQGFLQFPCLHVVAVVTGEGCYEEMVEATEDLSHRIDQQTVDTLRLKIGEVLQNAKPSRPNLSPRQHQALMDLRKD